jgi:hypothetical protein
MTDRRVATAMNMAVRQRNYRRARDRALARLAQAYPNLYKEYLRKRRRVMNKRVRNGLILLGALTLLVVARPWHESPALSHVEKPVISARTQATAGEKSENRRIAREYSKALGYTREQTACLITLWTRESRFDHLAKNQQGSSAYGIAQLLRERSSRPELQILHGIRYIEHRYRGDSCSALRHSDRKRWY